MHFKFFEGVKIFFYMFLKAMKERKLLMMMVIRLSIRK